MTLSDERLAKNEILFSRGNTARSTGLRTHARVFVLPGHERPAVEKVVEAHDSYLLVEKFVAVDAVTETDPRSDDPGP